jgi:SAM-dependent methyltransferase
MPIAPTLRCPCGERQTEAAAAYDAPPDGETRFDFRSQPYRRAYQSCTLCGHWFGQHDLDLTSMYESAYVDATYGGGDGMRRRFETLMALPFGRSDNRGRVARILAFAPHRTGAPVRPWLLDVGAGLGVFPAAMTESGWQVTALEKDRRMVEHLRSIPGVEALAEDVLELDPQTHGPFDAVTFNKVLEHVEDPQPLLESAGRLLSRDGFVYVEVPDVAASAVSPAREEFFVEHHHVFTPASLAMLAERSGLSVAAVERLREPSGKFTLRMFALNDSQ